MLNQMRKADQGYSHPNDDLITYGEDLESPKLQTVSPKKSSFLRSSLKAYNGRNSKQYYLTKPNFRAHQNDLLIP